MLYPEWKAKENLDNMATARKIDIKMESGGVKLFGIFVLRLGVESLAGRIYTRESAEKIIESFESKSKSGITHIGDILDVDAIKCDENHLTVSLINATHIVDSMYIGGDNNDILYADITLLSGLPHFDDVFESILRGDLLLRIALLGEIGYDREVMVEEFIKLYLMDSKFDTFDHCFYVPINFWERVENSLISIGK